MINKIHAMESLDKHPYKIDILTLMNQAIDYYPELNGIVYVGITDRTDTEASAYCQNDMIVFNPKHKPNIRTVFHELMHIVQYNDPDMPKTEKSCDIFSLARIPQHLINGSNEKSYYVYSKGDYSDVIAAQKALDYRASGKRNYIEYYYRLVEDKPETEKDKRMEKSRRR